MIVLFEALVVIILGLGAFSGVSAAVRSHLLAQKAYADGKRLVPWERFDSSIKSKSARRAYLRGISDDARLTELSGEEWASKDEIEKLDSEAYETYRNARKDAFKILGDSYDQFR